MSIPIQTWKTPSVKAICTFNISTAPWAGLSILHSLTEHSFITYLMHRHNIHCSKLSEAYLLQCSLSIKY